jgi:regulator of protease activity HflC (stomatin/prohibitin superfamily)
MPFFKGLPNEYIIRYSSGKVSKKGHGISFFYLSYNTNIVVIPTNTQDSNFIFNEVTGNSQNITIQGQITYKVSDPEKLNTVLDYTIDPKTKVPLSKDSEKLTQRLINVMHIKVKEQLKNMTLEEALKKGDTMANEILPQIKDEPILHTMGIECLSLFILSVKPTPEMAKAFEAEYREQLQKKADEAIYARRAAAVEQERKIKENELNTQITIEKQKKNLIQLQAENRIKEAETWSKSEEIRLKPYIKMNSAHLLALSMKALSERTKTIGNLNITSELLSSILDNLPKE